MSLTDQLRCSVPTEWAGHFSQCLYEWQSLEVGILALIAAGMSVYFLHRQISQSDRHEKERLQREHSSIRATLPLSLSSLVDPLRQMLISLNAAKLEVRQNRISTNFVPPDAPAEHVAELQGLIASTNKKSVVEPVAQIIREMQTLWARVKTLQDPREQRRRAGLIDNIDEWIVQAAQIHSLIESLFEYARDEKDEGPKFVRWERVSSIIFQLGIESQNLNEMIRRGVEKSPNFWSLK